MDDSTHFDAVHNVVHISVPRRTTDSGYLTPIDGGYINEDSVTGENDYEEIYHITKSPTYVNSGVDATVPVPPGPTSEQQDTEYERLRHRNRTHNLSGWLKLHKTLVAVLLTVLVTVVITAGIIVGVMMVVTKENTVVVKEDADKSEPSPATTLLVAKDGTDNDNNTKTPVTSQPIKTTPSVDPGNIASFVVIGGYQNERTESFDTVDIYRVDSGKIEWSHNGMPSPFTGDRLGRVVGNGDVYILGGRTYKDGVVYPQYSVARYSVADNTWQQLPDITWDTYQGPAVFIHQDTLYSAYNIDIWALELTQTSSGTWTEENIKLPHTVRGPDVVVSVGETVFIIGQYSWTSNSVISWRPGTDEPWRSVSDMNVARDRWLCSATDGVDRIWVMAGCYRDDIYYSDCSQTGFMEMYRVSTDTWTQLDAVPEYISSGPGNARATAEICGYHDGYIYAIFGICHAGCTIDNHFHIFNTIENTWSVSDTKLRTNAEDQAAVVVK